MRAVSRAIAIRRDVPTVWRLVADLSRYPAFVVGAARWERVADDRYWVLMQVGAIATGGEVAVTVDDDAHRVHWASIRGTRHEAALTVEDVDGRSSRLHFDLAFDLVGIAAPVTEWLAAPLVRRNLVASLETARHLLEHPTLPVTPDDGP